MIPARGGSKGLPGKNLRQLAGIPLVGWAARLSRRALRILGWPGRVVCSTDDPAIARAAEAWGAEAPFLRPPELASDTAASEAVVLHTLETLASKGERFDVVVRVQPTAPLTRVEDVVETVRTFAIGDGTSATTVVPARPPSWTYALEGSRLREVLPEPAGVVRRQDLPDYFALNGAVTATSPERLASRGALIEQASYAVVVPEDSGIDVDTAQDFARCEAVLARAAAGAMLRLGGREIGAGRPVFVIAEAGVNHNGDLALARRLVEAAAAAGADAVKFQTWITEKLLAPGAPLAAYQERNVGVGRTQFEMLKDLELPYEAHAELKDLAERLGLVFLSTPDEEDSADFLEELGVTAFKVGSAEITNLDLLGHVARKGRPLIVSTGMATIEEVEAAVRTIEAAGAPPLALLHCVSDYPCAPEECNLRAMHTLRAAFGRPVGFSDHSLGHEIAVAAVALGASILEKHLTLDTSLPGPDHRASLDPDGFARMISAVRASERALGDGCKQPTARELAHRPLMRKRWVAARALDAGARLTRADLALRRGDPEGYDPAEVGQIVGRELAVGLAAWETLTPRKLR